jgi:hypothetical protein
MDDADGRAGNAELLGQVANGLVDLPVDVPDSTAGVLCTARERQHCDRDLVG